MNKTKVTRLQGYKVTSKSLRLRSLVMPSLCPGAPAPLCFFMLAFLCSFTLPQLAAAKTIYIDGQLSTDCQGTYSIANRSCFGADGNAYRTFSAAANAAQAGDTVLIRSGTYNQRLSPNHSGSPGQFISFKNYNDELVAIAGPTLYPAINLTGKSYIAVDGLTVDNVRVYVDASGAENTIIKNCIFVNYAQSGSFGMIRYFNGAKNNKFINNTVSGIVPFSDYNDLLIIKNATHNLIQGNSFDTGTHTILAVRCGSYNIIRNNYFTSDKNKAMEIYDCCEAALDNSIPTKHNLVEGNIFAKTTPDGDSSPEAGIQFAGQHCILRKNIFYNNLGGINFALYSGTNCAMPGNFEAYRNFENKAYNNVFYSNHHGGILTGAATAAEAKFYNNIIKNNVFLANDFQMEAGNDWKPSWWINYLNGKPIQFKPGRLDGFVFENNDVVAPLGMENWVIVAGGSSPLVNLPTGSGNLQWWETNYPAAYQSNFSVLPLFVDETVHNFTLQAGSPLIDKGAFLTKASNSGSGTIMQVDDAGFFYDGYGIEGEIADEIQLEGQEEKARILNIDYATNTMTLNRELDWVAGQGVSLAYSGAAPDIGAYEYVPPQAAVVYGDVSGDTEVSAYDAALTAQATVGLITLTTEQAQKADVSGDAEVSAYDAALIAQRAVGLIDRFPVEG